MGHWKPTVQIPGWLALLAILLALILASRS